MSLITLILGIFIFLTTYSSIANAGWQERIGSLVISVFIAFPLAFIVVDLNDELAAVNALWYTFGFIGIISSAILFLFSRKNIRKEQQNRLQNSKDIISFFEESMKENEPIFKNVYFINFVRKYNQNFNFIELIVKKIKDHYMDLDYSENLDFVSNDFIQFLSLLIYSEDRDYFINLNEHGEKLISNLQQILNKSDLSLSLVELRNYITVKIFKDKLIEFQNNFQNRHSLIKDYYLRYKGSYHLEDIAFIYYLKYDLLSTISFSQIIDELERISHEENLHDFESELLQSNDKSLTTIDDVDLMDGEAFENFIALIYERMGYQVEITKSSNDQGVDIIATNLKEKIAIQTKCYSSPVGNKAIQEVIAGLTFYDSDKGIVVTNSIFTKSAIELAQKSHIELIDREKLKRMILEHYQ